MDTKDIWILLGGAFLGFLASLLATFAAPPIGSAFGKFKSGFIERNRASAVANYRRVLDLKLGNKDKCLYAINSWGFVILLALLSMMLLLAMAIRHISAAVTETPLLSEPSKWLGQMLSALSFAFAMIRLLGIILTTNRLENFEA